MSGAPAIPKAKAAPDEPVATPWRHRTHLLVRRAGRNKWLLRALVWGFLLLAWQLFAMWKGPFFMPTIPETIAGFGKLLTRGYHLTLLTSLQQLILGFFIASLIGIPLGALIGRSRLAEDLLAPYVNTLFVTAKEALLPLIIIMVGTQLMYRVTVVVLFAFFFPVMNTAAGVRFVDRKLIETATAFCTPKRRIFTQIMLPAAAPFVVAGVRLGLGMALKGMIIAELWVTVGTGGLMKGLGAFRELDVYFALMILIVAVAVGANELLRALERRLTPWEQHRVAEAP